MPSPRTDDEELEEDESKRDVAEYSRSSKPRSKNSRSEGKEADEDAGDSRNERTADNSSRSSTQNEKSAKKKTSSSSSSSSGRNKDRKSKSSSSSGSGGDKKGKSKESKPLLSDEEGSGNTAVSEDEREVEERRKTPKKKKKGSKAKKTRDNENSDGDERDDGDGADPSQDENESPRRKNKSGSGDKGPMSPIERMKQMRNRMSSSSSRQRPRPPPPQRQQAPSAESMDDRGVGVMVERTRDDQSDHQRPLADYGIGDNATRRGVKLDHCLCMNRETCVQCCGGSLRAGECGFTLERWLCGPVTSLSLAARDLAHACLTQPNGIGCLLNCVGLHEKPKDISIEREEEIIKNLPENACRDDDVCLVTVVGTAPLVDDVALLHPMVRVHVVDMYTGQYLGRASPALERDVSAAVAEGADEDRDGGDEEVRSRRVRRAGATTSYENWTELFRASKSTAAEAGGEGDAPFLRGKGGKHFKRDCGVVLPVSTKPHFVKKSSTALSWTGMDGTMMINEPYTTFLNPRALFLVEVVDFGAAHPNGRTAARMRENNGYVGLAWGFLMPIGMRGHLNIGHRGNLKDARGSAALGISRSESVAHLRSQNLLDQGEEGAAIVEAVLTSATGPSHVRGSGGVHPQGKFATQLGASSSTNRNGLQRRPSVAAHGENVLNPRLLVQLYHWQSLGPVAKAQAEARGLGSLPAPATGLVPPVYLQFLMRNRRRYPATLTMRIGPVRRTKTYAIRDRPTLPTHVERASKDAHLDELERFGFGQETASATAMARRGEDGSLTQVEPHVFKRLWDFGQGDCIAPTRLLCRRAVGRDGAFTVRYSHSGRYLAVAACDGEHHFPIQIYDLDAEEGRAVLKGPELSGHVSIVYDLNWSEDDRFLVSASADGTARVWALESITKPSVSRPMHSSTAMDTDAGTGGEDEKLEGENDEPTKQQQQQQQPVKKSSTATASAVGGRLYKILQHSPPTFLYAACFVPSLEPLPAAGGASDGGSATVEQDNKKPPNLFDDILEPCPSVLTGAFDGSLRMWNVEATDPKDCDMGLLGGYRAPVHRRSVTAVVVDRPNRRVYSGDADGIVWPWIWEARGNRPDSFPAERPLIHPALRGRSITSLALQPKKSRQRKHLLVAARGNVLLLFDMGAKSLLVTYHGASIRTSMIRACFSPDGKTVVAGSEEGQCNVWNAWVTNESGSLITPQTRKPCALAEMGFNAPLVGIAWNPKQHCVAMVAAGGNYPVLVTYSECNQHASANTGAAAGSSMSASGSGFDSSGLAVDGFGGNMPMMLPPIGGRANTPGAVSPFMPDPGDFMSVKAELTKAKKEKRDRVAKKLQEYKAKRDATKFTALANNTQVMNSAQDDDSETNDENKPMLSQSDMLSSKSTGEFKSGV